MTTKKADKPQNKFVLSDVIADERKVAPPVEIQLGEDKIVLVEPPALWGDEVLLAAQEGRIIEGARFLLGDDDYELFLKAGGTAALLFKILEDGFGGLGESLASTSS